LSQGSAVLGLARIKSDGSAKGRCGFIVLSQELKRHSCGMKGAGFAEARRRIGVLSPVSPEYCLANLYAALLFANNREHLRKLGNQRG
jgi:hypothetical protein